MAVLEVVSVSAHYGDIRALRDFSLFVEAGEISALLGRNGAGKTTALSVIAGLIKAGSGSIRLSGQDITDAPSYRRARLGMALVQENRRIFRRRTVEENLRLGGFWRYRSRRQLDAAIKDEYRRFPVLSERRNRPASTLSGGEQQMLAIAQALVARPTVLMLDEPSAGLAPEVVDRVLDSIEKLKEEGVAILLVEQIVDQALKTADRVAVLEVGRLVMTKLAVEVTDASEIENAYFGSRKPKG
jgi:branched-chain amino acid transport system ATP-binding protein